MPANAGALGISAQTLASAAQASTAASTTPAKTAHYVTALAAALLRGAWSDTNVSKDIKGYEVTWGEAVRKWGKHTGGNPNLIHRLRDISLLYLSSHAHGHNSPEYSGYITVSQSLPPPTTEVPRSNDSTAHPADVGAQAGSSTSSSAAEGSQSGSGSSFIHVPHPHLRRSKSKSLESDRAKATTPTAAPPAAGRSSIAGPRSSMVGSRGDIRQTEKAAFLSAADLDGDEPDEDDGWAEGSGWWNGVGLEQVDEVREGIRALEDDLSSGKLPPQEIPSAKATLAYHLHAVGDHQGALRVLSTLEWGGDPNLGVVAGDAAVLERIRARCIQGMSTEMIDPHSPSAIQSYLHTVSLSRLILPPSTPAYLSSSSSSVSKAPFEAYREVFRWLSASLCRAAVLSARQADNALQTLRILRTYHAFASSWPSSFRPRQRQKMLLLYLSALALAYPGSYTAAETPYLLDIGETTLSARAVWRKEVYQAIKEGQALLGQTTRFPKAGAVNRPVVRYTNLCVALADRCTALTKDVVDILWWSMNLTFQSHSILRHLTRLQDRHESHVDAKRTFELYVQLVLKAREAAEPDVTLHLQRRPTEAEPLVPPITGPTDTAATAKKAEKDAQAETPAVSVPGTDAAREAGSIPDKHGLITSDTDARLSDSSDRLTEETDAETDADFVGALMVGARVLTRNLGDPEEGWRYACLAKEVIKGCDDRGDSRQIGQRLRADVEEVLGIVRMSMASHGLDPISRPTYQAQAINHLLASTTLNPLSAKAFYHLAYCQAEARNIDDATDSIRSSLELDPNSVQAWHLLALLLTAKRDWESARKACDAGVAVWEAEEETDHAEEDDQDVPGAPSSSSATTGRNGSSVAVEHKDFAVPLPNLARPSAPCGPPILLPTGSLRPLPTAPYNKQPRSSRLEDVIRLRMTLNVITEKTSGPEMAMLRQQELFAFFSARSGSARGQFGYARGLSGAVGRGSMPSVASVGGLGGSYVSVPDSVGGMAAGTGQDAARGLVTVSPPTPSLTSGQILDREKPPIITHSVASSPGDTSPDGTTDDEGMEVLADPTAQGGVGRDKEKEQTGKRSLGLGGKKSLVKHLHVPGVKTVVGKGRPSSVRRSQSPTDTEIGVRQNRVASQSSIALSIAPTAVHSHFHGHTGALAAAKAPPPPPLASPSHGRTPGESRILSNLWLMSAATFRRWSKPEQSLVAINEAEVLDPENADVWIQLGLHYTSTNSPSPSTIEYERARSAYTKAILLRPLHPAGTVHLSKLYIELGEVDLAHSFLNQVTQDSGWDVPEAWYLLARVCKEQGRTERERECLVYALGLEETRGARRWRESVDPWL